MRFAALFICGVAMALGGSFGKVYTESVLTDAIRLEEETGEPRTRSGERLGRALNSFDDIAGAGLWLSVASAAFLFLGAAAEADRDGKSNELTKARLRQIERQNRP